MAAPTRSSKATPFSKGASFNSRSSFASWPAKSSMKSKSYESNVVAEDSEETDSTFLPRQLPVAVTHTQSKQSTLDGPKASRHTLSRASPSILGTRLPIAPAMCEASEGITSKLLSQGRASTRRVGQCVASRPEAPTNVNNYEQLLGEKFNTLSNQLSVETIELRRLMEVIGAAVGAVHKDLHQLFSSRGHRDMLGRAKTSIHPDAGDSRNLNSRAERWQNSLPIATCGRGFQAIGHDDPAHMPATDFQFTSTACLPIGQDSKRTWTDVAMPSRTDAPGLRLPINPRPDHTGTIAEEPRCDRIKLRCSFRVDSEPISIYGNSRDSTGSAQPNSADSWQNDSRKVSDGLQQAPTCRTQGGRKTVMGEFTSLKYKTTTTTQDHFNSESLAASSRWGCSASDGSCFFSQLPVLNPESRTRHLWDGCGCIIMLFECVYMPVALAWNLPERSFDTYMMWLTRIFWTADVMLRFNTGYYRNGELEVRRSAIALKYLKRYFVFDAVATGVDWITGVLFPNWEYRRTLRLLRFLRLSSMWQRLEKLNDLFLYDAWQNFVQLCMMLLSALLANHFVGCAWYYLGAYSNKDTGIGWLAVQETVDGVAKTYEQFSPLFQYLSSYHWSVVQMLVGSTQIAAYNSAERSFNIIINLLGSFFTAVLTAWLSAMWVQDYQSKHEARSALKAVSKYLRQVGMPPVIERRILQQLNVRLSASKHVSEADVPALQLLSKSLKSEMRREIWSNALLQSPGMFLLHSMDNSIFLNLCFELTYMACLGGDEIFQPRTKLHAAHVIVRGALQYQRHQEYGSSSVVVDEECCEEGTWIAEPALWCIEWTTVGHMQCYTVFAELVAIGPTTLETALRHSPHRGPRNLGKAYAGAYSELMGDVPAVGLSDIESPVEHAMVIMSMNLRDRCLACQAPLLQLQAKENSLNNLFSFQGRCIKTVADLDEEIKNGECCLVFDGERNIMRVAFVVLLNIVRSDGMCLMSVAKENDGQMVSKLQRPATKLKDGETVSEGAQRLLDKNLSEFGTGLRLETCTQEKVIRDTPRYGMQTCFYKSLYQVSFTDTNCSPVALDMDGVCGSRTLSTSSRTPRSCNLRMDPDIQLPTQVYYVKKDKSSDGVLYAWMDTLACEELQKNGPFLSEWTAKLMVPNASSKSVRSRRSSNAKKLFAKRTHTWLRSLPLGEQARQIG